MPSRFAAALFLLLAGAATAADWHAGKPLTNVFRLPSDQPAQVFTLEQGREGAMYVGGTNGLMRFNGTRWQPIPARGLVRELVFDGKRLWVGGYNAFGYLERDDTGQESFRDLAPLFAREMQGREIADLWDVAVRPEGVYFRGLHDLFAVTREGTKLGHWRHEGRFGSLGEWQGKLVVQFRGEGLKVLEGGQFVMVPGGEALADPLAYQFHALADGSLLARLATSYVNWTPEGRKPLRWKGTAPDARLHTRSRTLRDGRIAVSGSDGVVRIIDFAGFEQAEVPLSTAGLTRPVIDAVDGALWVADDTAVYRVGWPAHWHRFDEDLGLRGNVYRVRQAGGKLYALTGGGIFEARVNAQHHVTHFERREWAEGEGWDAHADGDRLLVADSLALKEIHAGRERLVSKRDLYPRVFAPSRRSATRLWVGLEHGVARLERGAQGWSLAARYPLEKTRVDSILELEGSRDLLLGTAAGAQRLVFEDDALVAHRYEALPLGNPAAAAGDVLLSRVGDAVIASSASGFFRFHGRGFAPSPSGYETLAATRAPFEIRTSADGTLWAFSHAQGFVKPLGAERWQPVEVGTFRRGLFSLFTLNADGTVYIGDSGTIYRFLPGGAPTGSRTPTLRVAAVEVQVRGAAPQRLQIADRIVLPPDPAPVTFELAFDDFARFDLPRFQAQVVGVEQKVRDSIEPTFTYPRLPPGTFRFEAVARDGAGRLHRLPPVEIEVERAWHEKLWFRSLAAISGLLLLVGLISLASRWRTRQLNELVALRTLELQTANARLADQAMRDSLTGVRNRRFFDEALSQVVAESADHEKTLALLMADVDHFKRFNDTHGHIAGDQLLVAIGHILTDVAKSLGGHAARYGGEEFALLLPEVTLDHAVRAAERIRQEVAALPAGITISIGVAHGRVHPEAARRMVALADEALYQAKAAGRDRVVTAEHAARQSEPRREAVTQDNPIDIDR